MRCAKYDFAARSQQRRRAQDGMTGRQREANVCVCISENVYLECTVDSKMSVFRIYILEYNNSKYLTAIGCGTPVEWMQVHTYTCTQRIHQLFQNLLTRIPTHFCRGDGYVN